MISDNFIFVRELPKSFSQIGAMLPSSPSLARHMVRSIKENTGPRKILEVGPGTGPFTRQILKLMGPDDSFVICEINPRFIERLQKTLAFNPDYLLNRERVRFFEGPVQQLPETAGYPDKYDVIVSSLPFINFAPDTVDEILQLFKTMVSDGGSLTFCQYVGICKLREYFSKPSTRNRVRGVDEVIHAWCESVENTGSVEKRVSLFNVPPATAISFMY